MTEYTARARKVYGGWEVTVAGVPGVKFKHRNPNEETVKERLATVLDGLDFKVRLVREFEGLAP